MAIHHQSQRKMVLKNRHDDVLDKDMQELQKRAKGPKKTGRGSKRQANGWKKTGNKGRVKADKRP
jgi:hypothetical protein